MGTLPQLLSSTNHVFHPTLGFDPVKAPTVLNRHTPEPRSRLWTFPSTHFLQHSQVYVTNMNRVNIILFERHHLMHRQWGIIKVVAHEYTHISGSRRPGLWRWPGGWLFKYKTIGLKTQERQDLFDLFRKREFPSDRRLVRRVHHPSLWLWCQLQQSAPSPAATRAPGAAGTRRF